MRNLVKRVAVVSGVGLRFRLYSRDKTPAHIGVLEIYGCAPPDRAEENVKVFGTFTPDLNHLADWLAEHEVDTVAMEATGVFWIPVFELLEARGLKVYLVNDRHMKGVPGRKS